MKNVETYFKSPDQDYWGPWLRSIFKEDIPKGLLNEVKPEKIREELIAFDERSQFAYLNKDYSKVISLLQSYDEKFDEKSSYFLNQRATVLARMGKAYAHLGQLQKAKSSLEELAISQDHIRELGKDYYPDMSLAHLLLKLKETTAPSEYFIALEEKGLLATELKEKWLNDIDQKIIPNIELEIYEYRHKEHSKDPRYKAESRQIIEFPDNPYQ
jgi:hypothetical protein